VGEHTRKKEKKVAAPSPAPHLRPREALHNHFGALVHDAVPERKTEVRKTLLPWCRSAHQGFSLLRLYMRLAGVLKPLIIIFGA
jgi:hypothetical protein